MKQIYKMIIPIIAGALFLTSCGGGEPPSPTLDVNAVYTQSMQTAYAQLTQTAMAVPATPTATNTPEETSTPKETNTPLITDTPLVTNTPLATPTAGICDNFILVKDVTIPDNSTVPAGTDFVKTWLVENAGPCTWNLNYRLVYGWASDNWKTIKSRPPASVKLSTVVIPGGQIEISVTLRAPTEPGNYWAAFRMQNDKGYNFGTLTNLSYPLLVVFKIVVEPTATATGTATTTPTP